MTWEWREIAQITKTHAGRNLTAKGILTLRRQLTPRFGSIPIIVFTADSYAVLHIAQQYRIERGPMLCYSPNPLDKNTHRVYIIPAN